MALEHIVLLVGGVGGAKLAYGLKQILRPEQLTVIVNTGDDFWFYGLKISPDLDTIMYTLAERIDRQQGWGVANDTTQALSALASYGEDTWFRLGDRDIATHLLRTNMLRDGATLTEVTAHLANQLGLVHRILPMSNDDVPTVVDTVEHGELPFQSYFVRHRWQPTVRSLRYTGSSEASATPEVVAAIQSADAIIIGPSNPWLSIAPILNVGNMRELLLQRDVPRVAVSPIIAGKAVKGPTAKIMQELGITASANQVAKYYGNVINGFVYDQTEHGNVVTDVKYEMMPTWMRTDWDKIRLAQLLITWLENWSET